MARVSQVDASALANEEKSFAAALDIVKLFTTLSTGALAFSIGLTSQSTISYPGPLRSAIIAGWYIFFVAIVSGVWAQALAPRLIRSKNPDPNDRSFQGAARICVFLFLIGVADLGVILTLTTPFGPAGEHLVVESPMQAVKRARTMIAPLFINKVNVVEYLKGIDPANPDQAVWHVQFDLQAQKGVPTPPAPTSVDVYVDPVSGCASSIQKPFAFRANGGGGCP